MFCQGNIFAPVVPRGNTVPCLKKRTFTTVADNQQTVQFPVYQGGKFSDIPGVQKTNC